MPAFSSLAPFRPSSPRWAVAFIAGLLGLTLGGCDVPGTIQLGPASEACAQIRDVGAAPIDIDLEQQADAWLIHFDIASANSVYIDNENGDPVYTLICDDPFANCLTSPVQVGDAVRGATAFETGNVAALAGAQKTVAVYAMEGGAHCTNTAEGVETFN